ncbi:MAG: hypothetical protein EZS28_002283 [Streblomastix strix]|uniref:Uncharacterized protein n=1 Tax=Streblomastix strix TaxID=222440 RepID=A0A5J4X4N9_9EUKA|nr:MAG: hypothetical protein EZS28_002283 [Streblomastix strix]
MSTPSASALDIGTPHFGFQEPGLQNMAITAAANILNLGSLLPTIIIQRINQITLLQFHRKSNNYLSLQFALHLFALINPTAKRRDQSTIGNRFETLNPFKRAKQQRSQSKPNRIEFRIATYSLIPETSIPRYIHNLFSKIEENRMIVRDKRSIRLLLKNLKSLRNKFRETTTSIDANDEMIFHDFEPNTQTSNQLENGWIQDPEEEDEFKDEDLGDEDDDDVIIEREIARGLLVQEIKKDEHQAAKEAERLRQQLWREREKEREREGGFGGWGDIQIKQKRGNKKKNQQSRRHNLKSNFYRLDKLTKIKIPSSYDRNHQYEQKSIGQEVSVRLKQKLQQQNFSASFKDDHRNQIVLKNRNDNLGNQFLIQSNNYNRQDQTQYFNSDNNSIGLYSSDNNSIIRSEVFERENDQVNPLKVIPLISLELTKSQVQEILPTLKERRINDSPFISSIPTFILSNSILMFTNMVPLFALKEPESASQITPTSRRLNLRDQNEKDNNNNGKETINQSQSTTGSPWMPPNEKTKLLELALYRIADSLMIRLELYLNEEGSHKSRQHPFNYRQNDPQIREQQSRSWVYKKAYQLFRRWKNQLENAELENSTPNSNKSPNTSQSQNAQYTSDSLRLRQNKSNLYSHPLTQGTAAQEQHPDQQEKDSDQILNTQDNQQRKSESNITYHKQASQLRQNRSTQSGSEKLIQQSINQSLQPLHDTLNIQTQSFDKNQFTPIISPKRNLNDNSQFKQQLSQQIHKQDEYLKGKYVRDNYMKSEDMQSVTNMSNVVGKTSTVNEFGGISINASSPQYNSFMDMIMIRIVHTLIPNLWHGEQIKKQIRIEKIKQKETGQNMDNQDVKYQKGINSKVLDNNVHLTPRAINSILMLIDILSLIIREEEIINSQMDQFQQQKINKRKRIGSFDTLTSKNHILTISQNKIDSFSSSTSVNVHTSPHRTSTSPRDLISYNSPSPSHSPRVSSFLSDSLSDSSHSNTSYADFSRQTYSQLSYAIPAQLLKHMHLLLTLSPLLHPSLSLRILRLVCLPSTALLYRQILGVFENEDQKDNKETIKEDKEMKHDQINLTNQESDYMFPTLIIQLAANTLTKVVDKQRNERASLVYKEIKVDQKTKKDENEEENEDWMIKKNDDQQETNIPLFIDLIDEALNNNENVWEMEVSKMSEDKIQSFHKKTEHIRVIWPLIESVQRIAELLPHSFANQYSGKSINAKGNVPNQNMIPPSLKNCIDTKLEQQYSFQIPIISAIRYVCAVLCFIGDLIPPYILTLLMNSLMYRQMQMTATFVAAKTASEAETEDKPLPTLQSLDPINQKQDEGQGTDTDKSGDKRTDIANPVKQQKQGFYLYSQEASDQLQTAVNTLVVILSKIIAKDKSRRWSQRQIERDITTQDDLPVRFRYILSVFLPYPKPSDIHLSQIQSSTSKSSLLSASTQTTTFIDMFLPYLLYVDA